MIPEEIKQQYPLKDKYDLLESFASEYQKRDIKMVTKYHLDATKMLGQNAIIYLARISHKAKFLFSGFIDTIPAKNSAVLFLTLRAHFETTASLGYFLYNLKKYYAKELSFDAITFLLYKLYAGSKDSSHIEEKPSIPGSVNVLTMIETCDKLLPSVLKDYEDYKNIKNIFSKMYTEFSEACHPNAIGLIFGTEVATANTSRFSERPSLGTKDQFCYLIDNMLYSCDFYFLFYDKCYAILKDNEHMPRVLKSIT